MKVQGYKRLNTSDFDEEQKKLVDKLASSLNITLEELVQLSNNKISFEENFKSVVRQITVQVDSSGIPQGNISISFPNNIIINPIGTTVIRHQNTTNPAVYPTSGVQLTWNQATATTLQVLHITGLPTGNTFILTVVVF